MRLRLQSSCSAPCSSASVACLVSSYASVLRMLGEMTMKASAAGGKLNPDLGACADVVCDPGAAAVRACDGLHDRQAQAHAASPARLVAAAEALERTLAELLAEPIALVANRQARMPVGAPRLER